MPTIVIARQNPVWLIAGLLFFGFIAWAGFWHISQSEGRFWGWGMGALSLLMCLIVLYRLVRDRGRAIWITGDALFLDGSSGLPLRDIEDVRLDSEAEWLNGILPVRFSIIAIQGRHGRMEKIRTRQIWGSGDATLARLKDALARHKAA